MDDVVKNETAKVCGWIRTHNGKKPSRYSDDPEERQMAEVLKRLHGRCGKPRIAGSSKASDRQLSVPEETYLHKELTAAVTVLKEQSWDACLVSCTFLQEQS